MRIKHDIVYGQHEDEYYSWWAECKSHNWYTAFYVNKCGAKAQVRRHKRYERKRNG